MNKIIAAIYGLYSVSFVFAFRAGNFDMFGFTIFLCVVFSALGLWLRKKWCRYFLVVISIFFCMTWFDALRQLYRTDWASGNPAWKTISLSTTAVAFFSVASTVFAFRNLENPSQSGNDKETTNI